MDLMIVVGVVVLAGVFAGWKVWGMVKPGPKAAGCSCSGAKKNGCGGCPLIKP